MLPLSAELLAAQTAQSRKPIIEITAGRLSGDFPFLGNAIANPDGYNQSVSLPLFLADGRLAVFYVANGQLRYTVTDAAVTEFSPFVVVDATTATYIDGLVMDNGNIAVVVQVSTSIIGLYIVSPAGVKISEVQLTSLAILAGATVSRTATGYAMVYTRNVSGVYSISLRTSADFITWAAASSVSISGLDSSHPLRDPRLYRLADGTYILIYSYATIANETSTIYNLQYSTSADLTTWTASATITNTSTISEDYISPAIVQRADGSLFIAAQKSNTYLVLRTASSGWDTTENIAPVNLWVDSAAGKLYLTSFYSGAGWKTFQGTCRIDIDTWQIDKFYGENTTPALPAPMADDVANCLNLDQNGIIDGLATVHRYDHARKAVAVVDYNQDTITGYYFDDMSVEYGAEYAQNVTHSINEMWGIYGYLRASAIDGGKLWLGFHYGYVYESKRAIIGYIDLSQVTSPYEFVTVNTTAGSSARVSEVGARFFFYPSSNIALIASEQLTNYDSPLHVVSLSEDSVIKCYRFADYADFPTKGVTNVALIDGTTIWAVPFWDTTFSADAHKWGLMSIDLNNDTITYYYPPWTTTAGNYLGNITVDETAGELFFRTTNGVAIFDYVRKTWDQLDNTVNPELPPNNLGAYQWAGGIAYDPTRRFLFYGDQGNTYLVPRDGVVNSISYIDNSDGWSEPALMVADYGNVAPGLAVSASDVTYATWTNTGLSPDTISWDSTAARINLDSYLIRDRAIQLNHILNEPSELSFAVSHGHLFDPHNDNSLLRPYLLKSKGVSVRIGEKIGGVEYWAMQGTYLIRGQRTRLKKGDYPIMEITCADQRCLWQDHQIVALNVDNQTPEAALTGAIVNNTAIAVENVIVPAMPLSFAFDAQWLDAYLTDIIDDISHRFQHFLFVRPDGNVEFRPFNFTADTTNTYGVGQIIEWSPDDQYSDMTNRYTVTGISLDDFQVTYAEERLGGLNGTVGWWGFKKDLPVYYSDDKQKTAKNPRLKVVETSTSILFKLAGKITERISEEDPYFHYCTVEVKAPNLVPLLISAIAIYVAGNAIGDITVGVGGGTTIPLGRKIEGVGLLLAMMVLGSVGNYQYEIYGNPIGYVKKSYSSNADDTDLQQELGQVVEQKTEGFLCHSPAHCQTVADFEMDMIKAQRSRITLEKIAHLQDEVGDIITCPHPYTGINKKIFITGITRRYKPDSDGGLFDNVEGWVI